MTPFDLAFAIAFGLTIGFVWIVTLVGLLGLTIRTECRITMERVGKSSRFRNR